MARMVFTSARIIITLIFWNLIRGTLSVRDRLQQFHCFLVCAVDVIYDKSLPELGFLGWKERMVLFARLRTPIA
jgi:hypothetical protein